MKSSHSHRSKKWYSSTSSKPTLRLAVSFPEARNLYQRTRHRRFRRVHTHSEFYSTQLQHLKSQADQPHKTEACNDGRPKLSRMQAEKKRERDSEWTGLGSWKLFTEFVSPNSLLFFSFKASSIRVKKWMLRDNQKELLAVTLLNGLQSKQINESFGIVLWVPSCALWIRQISEWKNTSKGTKY